MRRDAGGGLQFISAQLARARALLGGLARLTARGSRACVAVAPRLLAPSTKFRAKLCSAREPDLVDRPGTAWGRRARLAATSLAVARSNHYVFFSSSSFVRFCSDIIFIYLLKRKAFGWNCLCADRSMLSCMGFDILARDACMPHERSTRGSFAERGRHGRSYTSLLP